MDLLIIEKKERRADSKMKSEKIFRGHNIIEYKSPDDGMTIDNFFKTLGYAFLYKGLGEKSESNSAKRIDRLTFSGICYRKELLNQISKEGYIN